MSCNFICWWYIVNSADHNSIRKTPTWLWKRITMVRHGYQFQKKSSCLRVGPRFNAACAKIVSLYGQALSWAKEIKYLGIYLVSSTLMKCDLSHAKSCFYRGANEIFGKIGRFASVNVILEVLQSKCIPALLYGLEALPLNKTQLNSLDFVINRFLWNCSAPIISTSYKHVRICLTLICPMSS